MNISIIDGKQIKEEYIKEALELDYISYEEQYHLEINQCLEYYLKNDQIYFMAYENDINMIIGYINFSPITKNMYDRIKSGEVIDTSISSEDIEEYVDNRNVWGYLSSIVVHPDYRRKGIASILLSRLNKFIDTMRNEHNIIFNGIIADAVSDIGYHLLRTQGFSEVKNSEHDSRIMEKKGYRNAL